MRTILILGTVVVLMMVGSFIFSSTKPETETKTLAPPTPQTQKTTEIKAAFAIFTNGTFRVFTASMYHNLNNDVFIEASNPNLIRIKKLGITWDDFFKTLPMKLTGECLTTGTGRSFCTKANQTLRFYLNGIKDSTALEKIIKNGDQLLITYGSENDEQIEQQLQQISTIK